MRSTKDTLGERDQMPKRATAREIGHPCAGYNLHPHPLTRSVALKRRAGKRDLVHSTRVI